MLMYMYICVVVIHCQSNIISYLQILHKKNKSVLCSCSHAYAYHVGVCGAFDTYMYMSPAHTCRLNDCIIIYLVFLLTLYSVSENQL